MTGSLEFVCITETGVGAWLGARIPDWLAMDFAVRTAFIALIAPTLRRAPQVVAAFTAAVLSLAFAAIPYRLGLIIAAFVALLLGARLERHMQTTS